MSAYKLAGKRPVLKSQNLGHYSQLKLPQIEKKHSHQEPKHISKIKSGKLTHLNNHFDHQQTLLSQLYERCSSEMAAELPYDIEQRVNNILQNNQVAQQYYNEDEQNFEANIQRNRQLLKIQREKRQSVISKQTDQNNLSKGQKSRKSNKRIKQQHNIKKSLSKLRLLSESPTLKSRIDHGTLREESKIHHPSVERGGRSSSAKRPVVNRLQKKFNQIKNKISKRTKDKERKLHTEGQYEEPSDNLFDNIHNYLSNPHREAHQNLITNSKSKLRQRKEALQERLKDMEHRLSVERHPIKSGKEHKEDQRVKTEEDKGVDYGITWRRVKFLQNGDRTSKKISVDESNFEREVSHLGNLQQRNEHSLQRYIENQRLLHSLKFIKENHSKKQLKRQFLSK